MCRRFHFHLFYLLIYISIVICGDGGIMTYTSYEGGSVNIRCPYDAQFTDNTKYLCRGKCSTLKVLADKDIPIETGRTPDDTRFSLKDDKTATTFTITDLRAKDGGQYWCAVRRRVFETDVYREVFLSVKNVSHMSGVKGDELSVQCHYNHVINNHKFFCKGENLSLCETSGVKVSKEKVTNGRFSLIDDTSARVFTVTITNLTEEDSGMYWCGNIALRGSQQAHDNWISAVILKISEVTSESTSHKPTTASFHITHPASTDSSSRSATSSSSPSSLLTSSSSSAHSLSPNTETIKFVHNLNLHMILSLSPSGVTKQNYGVTNNVSQLLLQIDKMASVSEQLVETLDELEPEKLKRFKWHLKQRESALSDKLENADVTDTVDQMLERFGEDGAVKITCDILKKMKHTQLAVQLETKEEEDVLKQHKANMREKTEHIFEGKKENKTQLKKVYTELFIAEGDITDVNNEHEIMKIDRAFKCPKFKDTPIHCNDIFRLLKQKRNIVLTKGIAGIGKTFSVHKFILDWAEGTANQDVDAMFLFPFREMNLIKDKHISFHEFLLEFHPELKELKDATMFESCSLAFIFDGLDESRLPLSFDSAPLTCTNTQASVDAIFTSLVKGHLLPSSLIWITSRPAAANQIPPEFVGLFTEVRGFNDPQKEEYFRKRIENKTHASEIIKHVKTSRSLYIMCHIPVFCWIAATVLHDILVRNNGEDIPTTLTEMYIHFLLIQMNMKNQKYDEKNVRERTKLLGSNREMIFKMAKVAFEQLKKENVMFYEEDLQECGIDVSEDSGMIAEIFKKDSVLHEVKVYYFVHLSIQEFLAALHVYVCYQNNDMDDLSLFLEGSRPEKDLLYILLRKAIDYAQKDERGHYDLFIRFLLGISLDSNQQLLTGLLTRKENNKKCIAKTIQYIKQMQNKDMCRDKSINHFFCILELQDRSLYQQIKNYLKPGSGQKREISSSNCSALVYVLVMSEEVLDDFDAKKFSTTYEGRRRLVPAVRCCRRALFSDCGLTETCCETLASALQIENCPLIELDLSDNFNLEAGVKTLCAGLKSSNCKLEILRLAQCHLGQECCESLVSALSNVSCRLRELDLSGNDLQNSGLQHLLLGMENTERKLEILRKVFFVINMFYWFQI
ncbi:putative NACHT [Triplophysa rosa]|uniref:NACHT n=1 Tax=Triplophysa rosa TaxID=992332 RepID=A0A9W7WYJ2_TRIRA|nr:putative NACHT [Triplophysa rosa]